LRCRQRRSGAWSYPLTDLALQCGQPLGGPQRRHLLHADEHLAPLFRRNPLGSRARLLPAPIFDETLFGNHKCSRLNPTQNTLPIKTSRNCTYHFRLHANENLTAQQAGNSPAMIHSHYKGLANKGRGTKVVCSKAAEDCQDVIPLPVVNQKPEYSL